MAKSIVKIPSFTLRNRLSIQAGFLLGTLLVLGFYPKVNAETLQGKIMDRASFSESQVGRPIPSARLVLYDQTGKRLATKTTNRTGVYRFPKIGAGTYTLAIDRKDYSPSPLLVMLSVGIEDTVSRNFLLDRVPMQAGMALTSFGKKSKSGKKKTISLPYYPSLAEGIITTGRDGNFFQEAIENKISMSRFFDAEDTTLAYRQLWMALTWAEISNQNRPLASLVYLAHSLDSAWRETGNTSPSAMDPWLKIPVDSMEAFVQTLNRTFLTPSKKNSPEALFKTLIPRSMVVKLINEQMDLKAIPKAKKQAFLTKTKSLLGAKAASALQAKLKPPKPSRLAQRNSKGKTESLGPPEANIQALWKIVQELGNGKNPNPVAFYHLAWRNFEQGQAQESLTRLSRLGSMRPDYAPALRMEALCHLALQDTLAAMQNYDSLTKVESPEWQAKGCQGLAILQWQKGEDEKAEATLWRALGLDSRSMAARQSLLLLAEISLRRDSWISVEKLLDSLVLERPREAEGHYWLGRMALKRQQDGVALDHFRKASSLAPQRTEFAVASAQAYFDREEYTAALKILSPIRSRLKGEGLSMYGQCLLFKGRPQAAVDEFTILYTKEPSAQNLVPLATALSAAGQARKAVSLIQASVFTHDFLVRKALAEAQLELNDPLAALQLLRPLLAEKATDATLHDLAGRCAFKQRDYPNASSEFSLALKYREDYPAVKYQQGLALLKLGRSGEAHHYFQELLDSEKTSWHAKGLLGRGQAFAKENKLEAAVENLQKSYQAALSAETAAHLATTFLRMKDLEAASRWANQAIQLNPAEPLGLMVRVDILFAQHQDTEALVQAQGGLDKYPESCEFIIVAAKAFLQAGQTEEAKVLSLKAQRRCPEEAAPYFFLGTLASRTGTPGEARKHFEDYMRSGGDAKRVPVAYR